MFSVTIMLRRKTVIGVSKDTRSLASLRKVFVGKVREMVVAVNWLIY